MPFEEFHDIEEINEARRKAVAKSIRRITPQELTKFGEKIFPSPDYPWRETYFQLITEHPQSAFYHADAGEGVIFIYDHDVDKGLWSVPGRGMGRLSEKGRQIMIDAIERSH